MVCFVSAVPQRQRQLHPAKEITFCQEHFGKTNAEIQTGTVVRLVSSLCLASVQNPVSNVSDAREQQSYRSSLAEQPTRTSLDLELDLQACRTRQRQLMEELSTLRELKLRLEEPQAREGPELPHWALRDERFRCLLREAQRQVSLQKKSPPPPPQTCAPACRS